MSTRGSIHVFFPSWSETLPDGTRVKKTSPRAAYRLWFRAVRYQEGGYESKAKALAAGEKRKAELRAGLETDPSKYTLAALRDLSDALQETNEPATRRNHANSWARLLAFFPSGMPVRSIDTAALFRYIKHRRALGMSDNSNRLDLAWLRKAMKAAHDSDYLRKVPKFPKLSYQRREAVFVPGELERVLQHLPTGYRLLFRAAEECGWRSRSELTTRKWTDVDWGPERWACCQAIANAPLAIATDACPKCGSGRPGWLHVDAASTKAKKARSFPMTLVLRGILSEAKAHVEAVEKEHGRIIASVFVRDSGEPIRSYRDAWAQALRKAGIGKLPGRKGAWSSARVPHDLRRGALRRNQRAGLDEASRLALAGHADARTHALYLGTEQDQEILLAAARALDQQRHAVADQSTNVVQLSLFAKR